ncbi:MAG: hypothetical protein Fur0027_11280 [Raineya sp.]
MIELLGKIISGAVVGYTTNDLAVQMLFRKRFGLGGIVLKTHQQFVENISALVEKEIINHHTLAKEFDSPAFKQAIEQSVQDFYTQHLQALLQHTRLCDVPQAEKSWEKLADNLHQVVQKYLNKHFQELLEFITLQDFISEKQTQHLSEQIAQEILQIAQEIKLETSLAAILNEVSQNSLQDIFGEVFIRRVSENIQKIIQTYYNFLLQTPKDILQEIAAKVVHTVELDTLIRLLSQSLSQKPLQALITSQELENIADEVLRQIEKLLLSNKGKLIVQTLAKFVIQTLQKEQTTIFELLTPNLRQDFEAFLRKQLPIILKSFIAFIQEQKPKIDSLIDQTFRNNTQFALQEWLLDIFIGSVSENAEVVKKIINYIEKYDASELAEIATNYAVEYLQNNTISKIIAQIDEQKALSYLTDTLHKNFLEILAQIQPSAFNGYLDRKVGDFISSTQIENFLLNQWKTIEKSNWLHKLLIELRFEKIILRKIDEKQESFTKNALKSIFSETNFEQAALWLAGKAKEKLQEETIYQELQDFFKKTLQKNIQSLHIKQLLTPTDIQKITEILSQKSHKVLLNSWADFSEKPLQNYFQALGTDTLIHKQTAQYLQTTLLLELETLLKGRIEALVKQNLAPLPPERIRDMVENFMGREVAPISVLGAILGGVAGGALAAIPEADGNYAAMSALNGLVYGITGYGTNWLALRMIFRPYQQKRFVGLALPFTPGIISKNKSRFAQNMGKFVQQSLLKRESILNNFHGSRKILRQSLLELIQKEDYALLSNLIEKNKDTIAEYIQEKSLDYLLAWQDTLLEHINKALEDLLKQDLAQIDTSSLKARIKEQLNVSYIAEKSQQVTAHILNLGQNAPKKLASLLPTNTWELSEQLIAKFLRESIEKFSQTQGQSLWLPALENYLYKQYQIIIEKKIAQILQKNQIELLKNNFADFLRKQMSSPRAQSQVFEGLSGRLQKEIAPEKTIGEVLEGRIIGFIEENAIKLTESLIQQGMDWLAQNKKELANEVYEKAYEENKAAFIYKTVIRETVLELASYGIPNFFKKQMPEMVALIKREVGDIGKIPLSELNISINKQALQNWIVRFLQNQDLQEATGKVAEIFLEYSLLETPLVSFLKNQDLLSLKNLEKNFANEIRLLQAYSQRLLDTEKSELIAYISSFLANNMRAFAESYSQHWINEDSEAIAQKIIDFLLQSKAFEEEKNRWIDEVFFKMKQKPLHRYLASQHLQEDLGRTFKKLLAQEDVQMFLQKSIRNLSMEFLPKILPSLQADTKDFFAFNVLEAVFEALDENLPQLLLSVDLHKVVVEEIEAMHPKEIEALFNSFAALYFRQLINYGFGFGIVFGLGLDWALKGLKSVL